MQGLFKPLDFTHDLYFIYRTADFIDDLKLPEMRNESCMSSPLRPPAPSPIEDGLQTHHEEKICGKRTRDSDETGEKISPIFQLAEPLKNRQRKSYDDETRYLTPKPVITVRRLTDSSIFSSL